MAGPGPVDQVIPPATVVDLTDQFDDVQAKIDALQAAINGLNTGSGGGSGITIYNTSAAARGDVEAWISPTEKTIVRQAVWQDNTKRGLFTGGGGGKTLPSIVTASLPVGKEGAVYTTTTITGTGGSYTALDSYTWAVTGLPTGLALDANTGILSGTVTNTGSNHGTFTVAVTLTDTAGLTATASYSLVVAAAGATGLAFSFPTLADATVGVAYDSGAAVANAISGGTSPYYITSASLPNKKIHIDADGAGGNDSTGAATAQRGRLYSKTVTWGGTAVPPDTAIAAMTVALKVIDSAYHNVTDGVTTASSTTVTSATANFLVGDVGKAIYMPKLPSGTTIASRTNATTIVVSAAATASATAQRLVVGDTVSATGSLNINAAAASGPGTDLKGLIGTTTYTYDGFGHLAGDAVDPVANATAISQAAFNQAKTSPQGRLYSSATGTIMVGLASKPASWTIIQANKLNNWDLANITFKVAALQPAAAAKSLQAITIFGLNSATAPQLNFTVDGNGAQQYGGSKNPSPSGATTAINPYYGQQFHGVYLTTCGAAKGTLTIKNCRGVTGNRGDQGAGATDPNDWADETFHFVNHRGDGGDDLVITISNPDAAAKTSTSSGAKWHYINPAASNQVQVNASNVRHGMGCFCGGNLTLLPGSSFSNCGHAINIESGLPNPDGTHPTDLPTQVVVVGSATGATNGQVTTTGCDAAVILNGNYSKAMISVDVYGLDSTGDGKLPNASGKGQLGALTTSGVAPSTAYRFHNCRVYSPVYAGLNYSANAATVSAKTTLDTCGIKNDVSGTSVVRPGYQSTTGTFSVLP